ncbi:MAG: hypothetical protein ACI4GO_07285, partial [Hominenteromicrobium sp.]
NDSRTEGIGLLASRETIWIRRINHAAACPYESPAVQNPAVQKKEKPPAGQRLAAKKKNGGGIACHILSPILFDKRQRVKEDTKMEMQNAFDSSRSS